MAWREVLFRGKKAFAFADEGGALRLDEGRVPLRFRAGDAQTYFAAPANVELLAGGATQGGSDPPRFADADRAPKGPARKSSGRGAGPRRTDAASREAPDVPADRWIAYTDGACSGNPGPAGLGLLLTSPEGKREEYKEYLGNATNNVAELTAILRAAEKTPGDVPLTILTDSQYAIGVLAKGWKAKANAELIAETRKVLSARTGSTQFVYVAGHAGIDGNERADELARDAVSSRGR